MDSSGSGVRDAASERRFFVWLAWLGGCIAVLKALRIPNRWSATQAVLDYQFGFVRRGLFGESMRQLGVPIHRYKVFALVALLILALSLASLARMTARAKLFDSQRGQALAALFFGSYAITYFTHLVGYLDVVLLCLASCAASVRKPALQLVAGAITVTLGVLVHEQFVLSFLPVTLLPAVLHAIAKPRVAFIVGLGVVVVSSICGTLYVVHSPIDASTLAAIEAGVTAHVDYPVRPDVFPVLMRTFADNRAIMRDLAHQQWWRGEFENGFWLTLPVIAALLAGTCWRLREAALAGRTRTILTYGAALGASLAPMSLHIVGWDAVRWDVETVAASFIALGVVQRSTAEVIAATFVEHHVLVFQRLAFSLMLLSAASGTGFLDGLAAAHYPFFGVARDMYRHLVTGEFAPPHW